ncbi:MAG: hypothetical protein JWO95_2825 [Verrucomicrobiales bacterium]|nr:hypothetical protein [Verrucomicrobiales bacterium]
MQAANKRYRLILEYKADAIISEPNSIIFPFCVQLFEVGNFLERACFFHVLNYGLDALQ